MNPDHKKRILVTGGSGYVARHLVPELLKREFPVRVLVRDPDRLNNRSWKQQIEIVRSDLLVQTDLERAMQGIGTVYYLVHNMSSGRNYFNKEVDSARNLAAAASKAGVDHIIYLGGLAKPDSSIGSHLRSRLRTGDALREGRVPVTEFRASLIIGSGSISFEMIRYLTEQLPVAVGRRWVNNHAQAIAIRNVLDYLLLALENPTSRGKIYEIGGKDVITYAETMLDYAHLRGLKRSMVVFPWLPLRFMAVLAGRLTPVPATIAGPLMEGMRADSTVSSDLARQDFPEVQLLNYKESVREALSTLSPSSIEPAWENGNSSYRIKKEGFFVEAQRLEVKAAPAAVFKVVAEMGGRQGWYYLNLLWKLRGLVDKLAGGPGMRGRNITDSPKEGDIIDFYRVDLFEQGQRMRLKAELKAPGTGWMEWQVLPQREDTSTLIQIAYFAPRGLSGFFYWYFLLPFHHLVFAGLLKTIARRAVASPAVLSDIRERS
jgi:uncharacterized protein YbjT (DUF2867 family)